MHAFNPWDCCRILLGFCFFFFLFFWGWGIHRPIIMTHVGRPYDKKTKSLSVKLEDESIEPVVAYLQRKLRIKFAVPLFHVTDNEGIQDLDTSINWLINDLRAHKIGGIYLPNTRWFAVSPMLLINVLHNQALSLSLSPSSMGDALLHNLEYYSEWFCTQSTQKAKMGGESFQAKICAWELHLGFSSRVSFKVLEEVYIYISLMDGRGKKTKVKRWSDL